MGTLIVTVTTECENLIGSLPRGGGWELQGEDYKTQPGGDFTVGIITIGFDGDELSPAAEQALDTNDEVISYRTE